MNTSTTPPAEPVRPETPAFSGTPKKKRKWLTPVLAGVTAIAIGLFGGILIGQNTATTSQAASGTRTGTFPGGIEGGAAGGAGGGFTSGTISSIDGDTITLKLTDGSTVKVTTGSDTTVTKSDSSSVSDLAEGETIRVSGTADSSGNVTATTVTEGETAGGFGGGTPPSGAADSNG